MDKSILALGSGLAMITIGLGLAYVFGDNSILINETLSISDEITWVKNDGQI